MELLHLPLSQGTLWYFNQAGQYKDNQGQSTTEGNAHGEITGINKGQGQEWTYGRSHSYTQGKVTYTSTHLVNRHQGCNNGAGSSGGRTKGHTMQQTNCHKHIYIRAQQIQQNHQEVGSGTT